MTPLPSPKKNVIEFLLRVGGKEGMAGEMEPAEDMDQTEPDSTVFASNNQNRDQVILAVLQVEAPDPTGGGQEQEMVGGDQQQVSSSLFCM